MVKTKDFAESFKQIMEEIELGMRIKDKVTGFKGIAVSKCIYLNGCIQFAVKPPVDEKGDIKKDVWIDEAQLEIIDRGILPEPKAKPKSKSVPTPRLYRSANRRASGGHRSHPEM